MIVNDLKDHIQNDLKIMVLQKDRNQIADRQKIFSSWVVFSAYSGLRTGAILHWERVLYSKHQN